MPFSTFFPFFVAMNFILIESPVAIILQRPFSLYYCTERKIFISQLFSPIRTFLQTQYHKTIFLIIHIIPRLDSSRIFGVFPFISVIIKLIFTKSTRKLVHSLRSWIYSFSPAKPTFYSFFCHQFE